MHKVTGAVFLGATLLLAAAPRPAMADAVFVCNNCTSQGHFATARSGPVGYTYVVDQANAKLTLWDVIYDNELGRNFPEPKQVDSVTYERFLYMLDAKMTAQASGASNVVVNISPDGYNGTLFANNPFGGFSGSNAYEVAGSVTVRNQLGTNLAQSMTATGTSNQTLTDLGVTLNSVIMGMGFPSGFKIIITWKDGSKTTFTIDSSTANKAEYVPGESSDAQGNPIPDSSATNQDGAMNYVGSYYFDSNGSLADWVRAAADYGIPVNGSASGSRRMSCSWDGRALVCHYE
ncbi:hypothetical protein [Marilutibacter chinensis]|uniref:Uncharacterized protein n=1 Tax=Marilutibacter chinensis TaxID=2912247 RepID=A0ABS9HVH1_9GAMM|nr:hypothetical protein [Lysobacter chinensis]MCF7222345.1 hypothetical protein [Lysobacter chinensis]